MTCTANVRKLLLSSALFATLSVAGAANAITTVYGLTGAGLDDGAACPTGTFCSDPQPLEITSAYAVSGTITHDDVAQTVEIDITLTTASMVGEDLGGTFQETSEGIGEIVFSSVTYTTTGPLTAIVIGSQLQGIGTAPGTATGSYRQLDGSGVVVVADQAFGEVVSFGNFACLSGQCGFTVGTGNSFVLGVGSGSPTNYDFVHTFNVVLPEPASALLIVTGLIGLASAGHRRRN